MPRTSKAEYQQLEDELIALRSRLRALEAGCDQALEAELQESNARFRSVLENSLDAAYRRNLVTDSYDYMSPVIERITGWSADEMCAAENITAVMERIYPADRPLVEQALETTLVECRLKGKAFATLEYRFRCKNGEHRWLADHVTVLADDQGVPLYRLGIVRDITAEKRAQAALLQANQALQAEIAERSKAELNFKAAYEKLQAMWSVTALKQADIKTIADHILATIARMTGSAYGFYGFINEDESVMTIHAWSGEAMKDCSMVDKPQDFPIGAAGVWAEAVRRRQPFVLNDYPAGHPAKKGLPGGHVPLQNLLVVPYFSQGKIVAVAAVANRPMAYDQEDVTQVASFLDSVHAIVDGKRAEEALRQSEERFRQLAEDMPGYLCSFLPDGTITYANPALAAMVGISPDELVGRRFFDFLEPREQELVREAFATLTPGCPGETHEQGYLAPDGSRRYQEWHNRALFDETGNISRLQGVGIDITERRRAEEALRDNEERLKLALKATNDVVWDWDIIHDTQMWNEAGIQVFGWTDIVAEPQTAAWWVARVHPDDRQRVGDQFHAAVADPAQSRWQDEYRFRRADGSYALVLDRGYIRRDPNGQAVRMIGAMLDITERTQARERLQEKVAELERFNRLMVGRELRMIELKQEVNQLCSQLGRPPRYVLEFAAAGIPESTQALDESGG